MEHQISLAAPNSAPALPPKTVLVVDDQADIATIIRLTLEAEGYQILVASNGQQALQAVEEHAPDMLVMDVMMPEMSGFQALRHLKESEKTNHIPIIMLTAKSEEADILNGWLRGADLYMTKPFDPWELIANVNRIFQDLTHNDDNDFDSVLSMP